MTAYRFGAGNKNSVTLPGNRPSPCINAPLLCCHKGGLSPMKNTLHVLLLIVCALNVPAQTSGGKRRAPQRVQSMGESKLKEPRLPASSLSAQAQSLPIRRVILYSNGVAYIERRGAVTGHAEISLSFKQ